MGSDSALCALVVDDEADARSVLTHILENDGVKVLVAADGQQAMQTIQSATPDAVLLDVHMPGLNGMDVLKKIREIDDDLPVVLITAFADMHQSVEAMKRGAYDYLAKPFDNHEVARVARRALADGQLKKKLKAGTDKNPGTWSLAESMGTSDVVARIAADVHRVAKSGFSVLIIGETGTGKELVARAIHGGSPRRAAPFITVDCGAIPEPLLESELFGHEKGSFTGADRQTLGKFELAHGGTLLMDEIANMPLGSQAKLLRVIQDKLLYRVGGTKPVDADARLIAATNQDPKGMAEAGVFRKDLYYRLSEFTIHVPPLRERKDDLFYLAKRFLDMANRDLNKTISRFNEEAMERLMSYDWPGNVRELRSVVRRAALVGKEVIVEADLGINGTSVLASVLPPEAGCLPWKNMPLREIVQQSIRAVEKRVLTEALRFTGGNKARAARLLQIDYKTIHTKAKRFGIQTKGDDGDKTQIRNQEERRRAGGPRGRNLQQPDGVSFDGGGFGRHGRAAIPAPGGA